MALIAALTVPAGKRPRTSVSRPRNPEFRSGIPELKKGKAKSEYHDLTKKHTSKCKEFLPMRHHT